VAAPPPPPPPPPPPRPLPHPLPHPLLPPADQGESDSPPSTPTGYYACQQPATINAWRAAFADPALPWLFAQIAPNSGGSAEQGNLRQDQLAALALPRVGFAPTLDVGDGAPDNSWGDMCVPRHRPRRPPRAAGAAARAAPLTPCTRSATHR